MKCFSSNEVFYYLRYGALFRACKSFADKGFPFGILLPVQMSGDVPIHPSRKLIQATARNMNEVFVLPISYSHFWNLSMLHIHPEN